MQLELTIAFQHLTDMRQRVEIVFHALDLDHHLTIAIDGQRLILQALSSHLYLWQLTNLCQDGVSSRSCLTLQGSHLQLWVHLCEE